jgi:hypothetical protein
VMDAVVLSCCHKLRMLHRTASCLRVPRALAECCKSNPWLIWKVSSFITFNSKCWSKQPVKPLRFKFAAGFLYLEGNLSELMTTPQLTRSGGGSVAETPVASSSFLFGGQSGAAPVALAPGSLFGAKAAPAPASMFGAPVASSGAGGLFGGIGGIGGAGAAAPATASAVFGAAAAPAPAPASMFGAPVASSGAGGLFGGIGGIGGAGAAAPAAIPMLGASFAGGLSSSSSALSSSGSLFGAVGSTFGATIAPLPGATVNGSPRARNRLPRRKPRPHPSEPSQTNFLKEFLGPIEELIETKLVQNEKQMKDAKDRPDRAKEFEQLKIQKKTLEEQLGKQAVRFRDGTGINMSEAVYLHQEHVDQCKAILQHCGAQEQRNKEETSLKTILDNDFDKYCIYLDV